MKPIPDDIRERLLGDGEPLERTPELRTRLEQSEEGRDLIEAHEVARVMERLGDSVDGLTPQAIERSWEKVSARIGPGNETLHPKTVRETAGFTGLIDLFRRRWAFSAAALVVIALGLTYAFREERIATLDFVAGSVKITGDGSASTTVQGGIHETKLARRTKLEVGKGGAMIRYESGAGISLAAGTEVRVEDSLHLELNTGSIWVDLRSGGIGFLVTTAEAGALVTGTSFGMVADRDGTRVIVAEGTVEVSFRGIGSAGTVSVAAGQSVQVAATSGAVGSAQMGADVPDWVARLENLATAASVGELVPSVTSGNETGEEDP